MTLRGPGYKYTLPWSTIRRIDRYVPSGGVNGVKYVYITRRDRPPAGKWEMNPETVQLQDRPDLLDTLHRAWRANDSHRQQ